MGPLESKENLCLKSLDITTKLTHLPVEQSVPLYPAIHPSVHWSVSENLLHFTSKHWGEHGWHPIPYVPFGHSGMIILHFLVNFLHRKERR